jgi:hypothetical protein
METENMAVSSRRVADPKSLLNHLPAMGADRSPPARRGGPYHVPASVSKPHWIEAEMFWIHRGFALDTYG